MSSGLFFSNFNFIPFCFCLCCFWAFFLLECKMWHCTSTPASSLMDSKLIAQISKLFLSFYGNIRRHGPLPWQHNTVLITYFNNGLNESKSLYRHYSVTHANSSIHQDYELFNYFSNHKWLLISFWQFLEVETKSASLRHDSV